jgi:hypothetical protein
MTKTLKDFLGEASGILKVKNPDEQTFVDKHQVQRTNDRNGNDDDVFGGPKQKKIKAIERRKERKGYDPGDDAAVYEELKGNQHKIDANKNGKVDAHDFKLLRKDKGADDIPFEGPYRQAGVRKDKYGNVIKNVARHLARKGMKANEEVELDEEHDEKHHVVIFNYGRGVQSLWPSTKAPKTYTHKEAQDIVARNKSSPFTQMQAHVHSKPLSQAHTYVSGSAADKIDALQQKHGVNIKEETEQVDEDKVRVGTLAQRTQAYRDDKAKKAGAKLQTDPDTGTPDHFTPAMRRKRVGAHACGGGAGVE